jgi:AcrR family transcriptional regulator
MSLVIPNAHSKFERSYGILRDVAAPPTRPNLRDRYDGRRQALIDAAAELFAARGYHATTMQDLTDATGLAAGGLYHYIGSKEQLLIAICDELMEPLLAAVDALEPAAPEPFLRDFVQLWVAHVAAHRHHVLVFQQERTVIESEPQWRHVRRTRKRFEASLDAALADVETELATRDRQLALFALLGMVNHLPQWYRPRGRLTPAQIADGYVDLVLGRVGSTHGRA